MKTYTRFLVSLLKIGCIGFGGGSALIPVIEKELCDRQQLDEKEQIEKDIVVASITPGALPIEIVASVGRRCFGNKGMVSAAILLALPGTVGTILLLTLLSSFQETLLPVIEVISVVTSLWIASLLIRYISATVRQCYQESRVRGRKALFLIVAVFFLTGGKTGLISGSYLVLILLGVVTVLSVGEIYQKIRQKKWNLRRGEARRFEAGLLWLCLFLLIGFLAALLGRETLLLYGKGSLSAMLSFGGGDAYLTIADGIFVKSGLITELQYYRYIVPVVNLLPGSILCKTLAGVGYYVGWNVTKNAATGVLYALIAAFSGIAVSCGVFMLSYRLYDKLQKLRAFQMVNRWIRPVIAGLLLDVTISLLFQCMTILF